VQLVEVRLQIKRDGKRLKMGSKAPTPTPKYGKTGQNVREVQ
jgi:hypothetical protein